jgi:hypothetical protein
VSELANFTTFISLADSSCSFFQSTLVDLVEAAIEAEIIENLSSTQSSTTITEIVSDICTGINVLDTISEHVSTMGDDDFTMKKGFTLAKCICD